VPRDERKLLPLQFLLAPSLCRVVFGLLGGRGEESEYSNSFCPFGMSLLVR